MNINGCEIRPGADLPWSVLTEVDLSYANMTRSNFANSSFDDAKLNNAKQSLCAKRKRGASLRSNKETWVSGLTHDLGKRP